MGPSCFAGCVQVVDFYHAMEHAGAVLQVLLGTKEHTDYKRRLRRWAKRLLKDGVEKLIAQSREEAESLGRSAAVEKELGYFVGNVARMQYGSFRAQGYFIGSGVVEAGCKTAIGSRCNERFHRSGLSQEGFARRYGLKVSRLRYWLYHPRWRRASASAAPRWQEIRVNGWPADPLGVRDRAMLELFYSCGLRRAELCRLELTDLNPERRTLTIRRGKGKKDRVVPVGARAVAWLERYLKEVRPRLCLDTRTPALFLTGYGDAFNPDVVSRMTADWMKAAGLKGSCHLLRHTCATHMLEGGADIRYIQQLLGHEKLETTAIYAEVTIRQLQEVHARCHPSARGGAGDPPAAPGDSPDASPAPSISPEKPLPPGTPIG